MKKTLLATTALAFIAALAAVNVQAQVANISRTDASVSGVASSVMQNAAGVTYFDNDGKTLLLLKNNSGSGVTGVAITRKSAVYKDGYGSVPLTNVSITIPSGTTVAAGPFPTGRWNTVDGTVGVSLTTPSGISATAVRVR